VVYKIIIYTLPLTSRFKVEYRSNSSDYCGTRSFRNRTVWCAEGAR